MEDRKEIENTKDIGNEKEPDITNAVGGISENLSTGETADTSGEDAGSVDMSDAGELDLSEFADFRVDVSDIDFDNLEEKSVEPPRSKKRKILKGIGITFLVLALLCGGVLIGINIFLDRLNYDTGEKGEYGFHKIDVSLVLKNEGMGGEGDDFEDVDNDGEDIINILLIGEEALKVNGVSADGNGRSDTMMVLTINKKDKTIKLTSFMRDMYVDIPGYSRNKLNAPFAFGGPKLLCATLNLNFGIHIDAYVKVNFAGFEKVIDQLGGIEIELTETEAQYLNNNNYISKAENRTMVPGKQIANGNQALGYCRVRYVSCITGEADDFGRTARQRMVLEKVFEKYKEMGLVDLLGIAYEDLEYIKTDLTKEEIIDYVKLAAQLQFESLETFRVPIENSYVPGDVILGNASVTSEVVLASRSMNTQALRHFLYGEDFNPEDYLGGYQYYNSTLFWNEVYSGNFDGQNASLSDYAEPGEGTEGDGSAGNTGLGSGDTGNDSGQSGESGGGEAGY